MQIGSFNVDQEIESARIRLHDQIDGILRQNLIWRDRGMSFTLRSNQPLFGTGVHIEYQKSSNEIIFVFKVKP
ncbi:hypothetical protein SAMN05216302_101171 [Nitrosomonas aestuarii]|uniref:Uncharacterized protein n=1 Tax=Nitrosomonas aestuarii TaxID=52441 RepID=A0A1I4B8J4_9PROT|nr:hypothetical protein [Nitrosomonas aestuarii]SFK64650.1 hypothetical protein SAMN05216302_101171 [Nitrosomonas aestuarii]